MNGILLEGNSVRGFPVGYFALRLDAGNATDITLLSNIDGGSIYADVIADFEPGLDFARKHLGPPKYEAFAIPIGPGISHGLFDWLAGSWGPNPEKRQGAVLSLDANSTIQSEVGFSGALVVETRIPALDAASKQPGYLTFRFQPEFIGVKPGGGTLGLHLKLIKQKLWCASNFRLQIPGLDCTSVNKIDAFSVTRRLKTVSSGSGGVTLVPDKVEFPNLKITLSRAMAETWFDWHQSFVVNGNNDDTFERNGTISFLTSDLKQELSRIELQHLGIIRLASEPSDSARLIPRVTAELYCEQMLLVWTLSKV